jgi:hypothetical protein
MASAPRIRSNSPDTSELGIKTFNPAVSPQTDTAIQIDKKETPSQKAPSSFKGMSEREQVRMLWGSRRRKSRKGKSKKKRSTRRK